jgi:hypothetical protein
MSLFWASYYGKRPSARIAFILGASLGVSFYVYIGPIFPLLVWPYLLPLIRHRNRNKVLETLVYLVGGYLLMMLPVLLDFHIAQNGPLRAVSFYNSDVMLTNIRNNFLLFFRNSDFFYNHFVAGPYLDIISQILCVLGVIAAVIKRKTAHILLALSYVSCVLVMATISPSFTPTTRGIFFLPYGFVFAGLGLNVIYRYTGKHTSGYLYCGVILAAVFILNAYQSQFGVFANKSSGYTSLALIMQVLQKTRPTERVVIVMSENQSLNRYVWEFGSIFQAYGVDHIPYTIMKPYNVTCDPHSSRYLVFKHDTEAMMKMQSLSCGEQSAITYTVLSPYITYF